MGHGGGGRGVRRRTNAGLVRVQAALDAVHHGRTGEAAEDSLEVESTLEDRGEHRGNVVEVEGDDDRADTQVDDGHDGNEEARDLGQAARAAQDRTCHQNREDGTDDPGSPLVCPAVLGERVGDVEGCQQVEATHVGKDQNDGEEVGEPVLLKSRLDVVGGTTVGVVRAALLVDLRERRLNEGGSATERGDDPHPEHGTGTAERHGRRHTGDVTDAHARGRGDHQCAEGGDTAFFLRRLHHDAKRIHKQAQRESARADKEVQADADQEGDEHVRIHKA